MSEVTIEGLADWLKQVGKLGERHEAAAERFRGATGEEAAELNQEAEDFLTKLDTMADVVRSLRDCLSEVENYSADYPELERDAKEDARETIAGYLEDMLGHLLAWPYDEDEEPK